VKPDFRAVLCISIEDHKRNLAYAGTLGLPPVSQEPRVGPLALVGGGPSVREHVAGLQSWPGDVWAINGAWRWSKDRGIDATFFTVDPTDLVVPFVPGVERAILCNSCDPALFKALAQADVQMFSYDMFAKYQAVSSSVVCAVLVAMEMGYRSVVIFGCESSYGETTHAYVDEPKPNLMKVQCGEEFFFTEPWLALQAAELATMCREFPEFVTERCGGFLRALVKHREYDVLSGTKSLHEKLGLEVAA
jgi:hypothetical protein